MKTGDISGWIIGIYFFLKNHWLDYSWALRAKAFHRKPRNIIFQLLQVGIFWHVLEPVKCKEMLTS